ncbi:hypothetical protein ZWY2020_058020 [Hordeum vulgare]|nr:hypothetical protein ZWY2020_058020 [Hordeum vulgare]
MAVSNRRFPFPSPSLISLRPVRTTIRDAGRKSNLANGSPTCTVKSNPEDACRLPCRMGAMYETFISSLVSLFAGPTASSLLLPTPAAGFDPIAAPPPLRLRPAR